MKTPTISSQIAAERTVKSTVQFTEKELWTITAALSQRRTYQVMQACADGATPEDFKVRCRMADEAQELCERLDRLREEHKTRVMREARRLDRNASMQRNADSWIPVVQQQQV